MQPGQFAAEQVVTLEGPKVNCTTFAFSRYAMQAVEISRTDARTLGITAPLRMSGDPAALRGFV